MQRLKKADLGATLELSEFTCFTGTKVQMLTQKALLYFACGAPPPNFAEFTCFTGTKVQILTQKALLDFACDAPTPNDLVRSKMGGQVDVALMNEFSVDLIFQALNLLALLEQKWYKSTNTSGRSAHE
jgi:hypothetical protein